MRTLRNQRDLENESWKCSIKIEFESQVSSDEDRRDMKKNIPPNNKHFNTAQELLHTLKIDYIMHLKKSFYSLQ